MRIGHRVRIRRNAAARLRAGSSALLLLALTAAGSALRAQQPFHRGAPLSATASVQLFTAAGSVVVEGWDRDSIDIQGTIGRGLTPHSGGDLLAFKMSTYDGRQDLSQPSHLVIRVPRRAQLWLKGTTGTITARALDGTVDLYSISGPIDAREMRGDLTAESMRGDLRVRGSLRWLRVRSGEGRVYVEGVVRDVAATTVRGSITLRGSADRARVETVSGLVEVALPATASSSLDIDTHDGSVRLQLGPERNATVNLFTHAGRIRNTLSAATPSASGLKGSALSMVLGAGASRVSVRTFSGEIVLGGR